MSRFLEADFEYEVYILWDLNYEDRVFWFKKQDSQYMITEVERSYQLWVACRNYYMED